MRIIENMPLTRALLALGAGLAHEVEAVMRRKAAPAVPAQPPKLTRQQQRAAARRAARGRN